MPKPLFHLVFDIVVKTKNIVQVIFEKEHYGDYLHSVLFFTEEEYNTLTPELLEKLKQEKLNYYLETGKGCLPFPETSVPWGPSDLNVSRILLEAAEVSKDDIVCDIGCGDGRVLIDAVKRYEVEAIGIDIDPWKIQLAQEDADLQGLHDKMTFLCKNAIEESLPKASIYYLFQLEWFMDSLKEQLNRLPSGTKIISKRFNFTDQSWTPHKIVNCGTETGFIWIVN
jgi:SAM-dependent methyltransferase